MADESLRLLLLHPAPHIKIIKNLSAALAEIMEQVEIKISRARAFERNVKHPLKLRAVLHSVPKRKLCRKLKAFARITLYKRLARRQLGLPVSVNISGIKICTSALHKQIDRSLCLIYIGPTVLHRNVHKSEAELLYFIRRIIRHLRNGLPFGILKCTTGCREKRQPVFYQISHCSGELSRFEKSCQAR